MKNVKKLLVKALMVVVFAGFVSIPVLANHHVEKVQVVKENGFMVLKDENKKMSTIASKVTEIYKNGSVNVVNMFDKEDIVEIDKSDLKEKLSVGDNVLVTFKHDSIVKIKKFNKDEMQFTVAKEKSNVYTIDGFDSKKKTYDAKGSDKEHITFTLDEVNGMISDNPIGQEVKVLDDGTILAKSQTQKEKTVTHYVTVQSINNQFAEAIDYSQPDGDYVLDKQGLKVGDVVEVKENKFGEVIKTRVVPQSEKDAHMCK